MTRNLRWHILTGEYPPQRGGVADYTRSVAHGLAAAGDDVVVWAPQTAVGDPVDRDICVRRLAGVFGPKALAQLDRELDRVPGRVLVQYTPHAFGWKAMNVPFCLWLWSRRRTLDVMFHEVAYPFGRRQPGKHNLLAAVHRGMASLLIRAAQRVFVSIPGWKPLLHGLAARSPDPIWTPIPSNLPTTVDAVEVARVRATALGESARWLVGHFGTYGPAIAERLAAAVSAMVQQNPAVRVALLGRGASEFARKWTDHPTWQKRFLVLGDQNACAAATYLAACDVLLQPYPDGISSRRGTAMAGLSLGRPIVTTQGFLTEPLWHASEAVAFAPPEELATAVLEMLNDAPRRAELGRRAAGLYQAQFAVEHTIHQLRCPYSHAK